MVRRFLLLLVLLPVFSWADAAPLGSVQTVIACVAASSGNQGPCPDGQVQSVVTAYVISSTEAARFELSAQPFDPDKATQLFSFGLVTTLSFWLLAWGCGQVLRMIDWS